MAPEDDTNEYHNADLSREWATRAASGYGGNNENAIALALIYVGDVVREMNVTATREETLYVQNEAEEE